MSYTENTATEKRDVYERVTSQIVNAIEQGVSSWRMLWHTSGKFAFSPINVTSKKPYRGINTVCLWAAAQAKGYERGEWATYQQWQDRGAQVRKGEKATLVVFWKFANSETQEDGEEHTANSSRLLFTRGYSAIAAMHERRILAEIPTATFERLPPLWPSLNGKPRHLFRIGNISPSYGGPEYSLYLESTKGVLLLVLLCPQGQDDIYVPALKWIGGGTQLMERVGYATDSAD